MEETSSLDIVTAHGYTLALSVCVHSSWWCDTGIDKCQQLYCRLHATSWYRLPDGARADEASPQTVCFQFAVWWWTQADLRQWLVPAQQYEDGPCRGIAAETKWFEVCFATVRGIWLMWLYIKGIATIISTLCCYWSCLTDLILSILCSKARPLHCMDFPFLYLFETQCCCWKTYMNSFFA